MPRIPFSIYEKTLIRQCALAVWNEIAYDTFVTLYSEGRDTMTRDEVVEVVLDCDRVVRKMESISPDVAVRMRRIDARQIERIVRDAFPHKEYA